MTAQILWTSERLTEAARMWTEGETVESIIKKLGGSPQGFKWARRMHRELFPDRHRPKGVRKDAWTPQQFERAVKMWEANHSVNEIGAAIGVSRGSVTGMANRNRDKFPTRPAPAFHRGGKKRKSPTKAIREVIYEDDDMPIAAPMVTVPPTEYDLSRLPGVELWRLETGECKWAMNDGKPFLFCGAATGRGDPYCEHHTKRAYTVPPPSMRMRNLRPHYRDV